MAHTIFQWPHLSNHTLSTSARKPVSRKKVLTITAVLIIATASFSTLAYLYFVSNSSIVTPLSYRKVLDTGSVLVQQFRDLQTAYFTINTADWYIKWQNATPSVPEGTQLELVVRDAYTTSGQGVFWLDLNESVNLSILGVFYLNITVWPINRHPYHVPSSFNATVQVWEAEA